MGVNVDSILTNLGFTICNPKVDNNLWKSWYSGKVDKVHSYIVQYMNTSLQCEMKTLGMSKTVCEDWADSLANEKLKITIPKDSEKLYVILDDTDNDFKTLLNEAIEKSFSVGNGVILLGLTEFDYNEKNQQIISNKSGKITIDYIDFENVKVLNIERNRITEAAFISESAKYTDISIHYKDENNNYIIRDLRVNNKDNSIIKDRIINTNSNIKWFSDIRPNIVNNSILHNGLGISIYANALDVLESLDRKYDGFYNEFILKRPKTFIGEDMMSVTVMQGNDGQNVRKVEYDPFKTIVFAVDMKDNATGKLPLEVSAPAIQEQPYINAINMDLNILSKKCGFGTERYKFDKGGVATATQIISENSDMARSLKKHENLLRGRIKELIKGIIFINNAYTQNEQIQECLDNEIMVDFGDSIIEDEGAVIERDRKDVEMGIMTPVEYREKHYGEDEETARNKVISALINQYKDYLKDGVITPGQFVKLVYGVDNTELEEYITKQLEKNDYDPITAFDEE